LHFIYGLAFHDQGKDSSDEEDLDDIPDDDQYDTEDSFIDDAELVCICFFTQLLIDWINFFFHCAFFWS